jgi:hypothetical protein
LDFLDDLEPRANITFNYQITPVQVNALPNPNIPKNDFDGREAVWMYEALGLLGFAKNKRGIDQYVSRLNQSNSQSFVAFFTKYPLAHFAYALPTLGYLCMNYYNDGWGVENINNVFGHEVCHIFGAADEYGPCSCDPSGYYQIPNLNCINCTNNQIPCLMNRNDLVMCQYSRLQLGWYFNNSVVKSDDM